MKAGAATPRQPDYLAVARIGRPHGVTGELHAEVLTDFAALRFAPGSSLWVGKSPDNVAPVLIEAGRPHGQGYLIRLEGVGDREAAAALTGRYLYVPRAEAAELQPDEYYVSDLVGLEVVTVAGRQLGHVGSLIETGSADVLVVEGPAGTVLVPMTGEIVTAIDLALGRISVDPLPGLLDD